jgi:hypothetical protein
VGDDLVGKEGGGRGLVIIGKQRREKGGDL